MPMNLFDILLPLMHEEKLRRDVILASVFHRYTTRFVVVLFYCEIPEGDLVICSRGRKHGIFRRVPFNGGHWSLVPGKLSHRSRF